jgi:hypothetical protein
VTVYVDDWRQQATIGRVSDTWSHLFAGPWDDPAELHQIAARIGLRRSWYQAKPWPRGHYDVAEARDRGRGNPPAAAPGQALIQPESAPWTYVSCAQLPAARIRALTLRQPWAHAIAELGNRTENRTWRLRWGYLWVHVGARSGWDSACLRHPALASAWRCRHGADVPVDPDAALITFSAVVAFIRVTGAHHAADCTRSCGRPCDAWAADGQVHSQFELAAVLPEPVPTDGKQRLWLLPPAAESASRELLATLRSFARLNLMGADIVEVAPAYDYAQITGIAAAHVGYELLSAFAAGRAPNRISTRPSLLLLIIKRRRDAS